jgi:hypothetical protein
MLGRRGDVMTLAPFRRAFEDVQRRLARSSVAAVKIENPVELYVFEACVAMKLGTSRWNTFKTH